MKSKFKFSIYELTVPQLFFILGGIILFAPFVFTLGAFSGHWDFSETGQIGDTLGGITTPFISAFAAVLIFIAFKEQVRANNIIKESQIIQSIYLEINRLEEDVNDVMSLTDYLRKVKSNVYNWKGEPDTEPEVKLDEYHLYKLRYLFFVFEGIFDQVDKLPEYERKQFYDRLNALYEFRYNKFLNDVLGLLTSFKKFDSYTQSMVNIVVQESLGFQGSRLFGYLIPK